MIPAVRERSRRAEELRMLPPETVEDFKRNEFLRISMRKRFGGPGHDLEVIADVSSSTEAPASRVVSTTRTGRSSTGSLSGAPTGAESFGAVRCFAVRKTGLQCTALCLLALALIVPRTAAAAAPRRAERPNIVFVLADDLDLPELAYLPNTVRLIGARGATFDNYFVSNSLCCPSRATTLRGQYAHNTGVLSNGGPSGGFDAAYRAGIERDTFATRLNRTGYRAALFGKYLNHYPEGATPSYIPPGWTSWGSPVGGHPYSEYDYTLNLNGRGVAYGTAPDDYGTHVYMGLADKFIQTSAASHKPFFLSVDVFAPHTPSVPAHEDTARFPGVQAPRTPAFDLADVSSMPGYIRDLPPFTPAETVAIDDLYRRRLQSLQAVDRGVEQLVTTLRNAGELSRTFFVFASDNGYHLGQHRLPAGKGTPYDTDLRVPLLVRGPGIEAGTHVHAMSVNTDLAPTFLAMAGVRPPRFVDGRSMLPLARGREHGSGPDRSAFLVEHWLSRPGASGGRGVDEPEDVDELDPRLHPTSLQGPDKLRDHTVLGRLRLIPGYAGVRTSRFLYVEYDGGDRELYDVRHDPDEIDNLAGTRPRLEQRLARRLDALRDCRAAGCRRSENA